MNPPVQHSMKSFLNPYIAKFIVVFNYVCLPACLPGGDTTHVVFISCQMLLLIILSFPGVPPPRQHRPPFLSPLPPLLNLRDRDSLFPLLTHPTIFSFSSFDHPPQPPCVCRTSFIHTLFPLLIHTSGKG